MIVRDGGFAFEASAFGPASRGILCAIMMLPGMRLGFPEDLAVGLSLLFVLRFPE